MVVPRASRVLTVVPQRAGAVDAAHAGERAKQRPANGPARRRSHEGSAGAGSGQKAVRPVQVERAGAAAAANGSAGERYVPGHGAGAEIHQKKATAALAGPARGEDARAADAER